jgi:hypothetical protein
VREHVENSAGAGVPPGEVTSQLLDERRGILWRWCIYIFTDHTGSMQGIINIDERGSSRSYRVANLHYLS